MTDPMYEENMFDYFDGEDQEDSNIDSDDEGEIDYPDEPSEHSDDEEETEEEQKAYTTFLPWFFREYSRPDVGQMGTCGVCFQTLRVASTPLSQLDECVWTPNNQHNMLFTMPCSNHMICANCIRQSLLRPTTADSLLREGSGHLPCLGDSKCMNARGQRTTVHLQTCKRLFTEDEWKSNCFSERWKRVEQSRSMQEHHSHLIPLQPTPIAFLPTMLTQFRLLLNCGVPCVQCPVCEVYLQRSTSCFAMRHCDWEVCWMCGKIERRLEASHWEKCPRYDHDALFKKYGFACCEDRCFNEHKTCQLEAHQQGRESMDRIRKAYMVYRFYASLPIESQTLLLQSLSFAELELTKKLFAFYFEIRTHAICLGQITQP